MTLDQVAGDRRLARLPVAVAVQVGHRREGQAGQAGLGGDDLDPVRIGDGDRAVGGSEVNPVADRSARSHRDTMKVTCR